MKSASPPVQKPLPAQPPGEGFADEILVRDPDTGDPPPSFNFQNFAPGCYRKLPTCRD